MAEHARGDIDPHYGIGTQTEIAAEIITGGADYLLPVDDGIKSKRLQAAWNSDYQLNVLLG